MNVDIVGVSPSQCFRSTSNLDSLLFARAAHS